jgi:hypothetical protein
MNPTYLKEIIINHSVLQGQIDEIENNLYPVMREVIAIRKRQCTKFLAEYKEIHYGCYRFPLYFYADVVESIDRVNSEVIVFNCCEYGTHGDSDTNFVVNLPAYLIHDFYFDRDKFNKFFSDEYKLLENNYLLEQKKTVDTNTESMRAEFDRLKQIFEPSEK